jgi:hypothetical protein
MKAVWAALVMCFVLGSTVLAYTESQADQGAEVYAFRCSTCHGDRLQGLTDEFRATWPEEDQNCWTPKCHGLNYPDMGFAIPRHVQGLVGPDIRAHFPTAENLYTFIKLTMPYQDPSLLTDEERWAVTAFLLRENGILADGELLDDTTAASIRLRPDTPSIPASPTYSSGSQAALPATPPDPAQPTIPASSPSAPTEPARDLRWLWVLPVAALIGVAAAVVRLTRSR